MSQSDYIHLKRVKAMLTDKTSLPAVLSSQNYTDFTAFSTAQTVINTLPDYNYLSSPDTVRVFDMVQPVTCVTFPLCSEDETVDVYSIRENRVLNPANPDACALVSTSNRPRVSAKKSVVSSAQCGILSNLRSQRACYVYRWPGDNRVKRVMQ